jgi:hypothetical protein
MASDFDLLDLGKYLGTALQSTNQYKDNFIETEEVTDITLAAIETINLTGSWTIYKLNLGDNSFVLDHPVYGYLDSSTLALDGGYGDATYNPEYFPLTFPILFDNSVLAASELHSSGFL